MRYKERFDPALTAAAFLLALALNSTAAETNVLTRTSFESEIYDPVSGDVIVPAERPPWHPYTYPYSWGYPEPSPGSIRLLDTLYLDPPDMTNTVLQFTFDNSAYEPVPSGGAYGLGFGGPHNWIDADPSILSSKRADYILSFDARVEGLLPGQTANGEAQTIFVVPDDTVQPPDENFDPDAILQLNINFNPTSEWQRFVLNLGGANFGSGTSQDTMAQYKDMVSEIRFAFNFHLPNENFGFDTENAIYVDNLQLEVIARETTNSLPTSEQVIVDWNFDDKDSWYNYTYNWSESTSFGSIVANQEAQGVGVDGTDGWLLEFDTTAFATAPPAYAGVGSGTGGPFTGSFINTTNLASYKIYFDARVDGLAAGKSSTPGQLEFLLRAPDDTLSPPDPLQDDDVFFSSKYDVTLKTNWQSFSFTLDEAATTDEHFANFTEYFGITSSVQPQFHVTGAGADFGFDSNNIVLIDNFRVVRLVQGIPALSIGREGDQLVITWSAPASGTVKLQRAGSAEGPFEDVADATSPYTVPAITDPAQFFRNVWAP